jgi:hypothetical protein
MSLDPIPRYILLRDVLFKPSDDPELVSARESALKSKTINRLIEQQTFGRFIWPLLLSLLILIPRMAVLMNPQ